MLPSMKDTPITKLLDKDTRLQQNSQQDTRAMTPQQEIIYSKSLALSLRITFTMAECYLHDVCLLQISLGTYLLWQATGQTSQRLPRQSSALAECARSLQKEAHHQPSEDGGRSPSLRQSYWLRGQGKAPRPGAT